MIASGPASLRLAAVTFAATFFLPVYGEGKELLDLSHFLQNVASQKQQVVPSSITGRISSNDPGGTDEDCGVYLREDGVEHVLLDLQGAGVLHSLWVEEPQGYLRFYWDGSKTPQFEMLWTELADGTIPPLEYPFAYQLEGSSELVFPFPFEKGLKVTLTGQSYSEHSLDYQLFTDDAVVKSWWPGMPLPDTFESIKSALDRDLKEPHAIEWGSEVWKSDEELLYSGGRDISFVPQADVLVREVLFLQSANDLFPQGFVFQLKTESEDSAVPWNALTGLWQGTEDQSSIYTGHHGRRSWFRYPFLLKRGEELAFSWDDEKQGEMFGRAIIRYDLIDDGTASQPRLGVYSTELRELQTATMDVTGSGRVVQTSFNYGSLNKTAVCESDLKLVVDGVEELPWQTTSLAGLLRTSRMGLLNSFSSGSSGLSVIDDQMISGYSSFPGEGIVYHKSISLEMDVPSCTSGTLVLVTLEQDFSESSSVVPIVASSQSDFGQVIRQTLSEGNTVYQYHQAPLEGTVSPQQVEVHSDMQEFSGSFQLTQQLEELSHLRVSLDLPYGWKGRLTCEGESKDVLDLGWPWFDYYPSTKGDQEYQWKVFPPSDIPGGEFIVQLRAEAQLPGGGRQLLRRPVSVQVAPRCEPVLEFIPGLTDDGLTSVTLPGKFKTEAGDQVYALAKYEGSDVCGVSTATLTYRMGMYENTRDYTDPPEVFLPPDGEVYADLLCDGKPHWIRFPVGKYQSWFKNGRELAFSLEEFGHVSIDQVRMYHPVSPPEVEGWSRRVPYVESPVKAFHLPRYRLLLQKKQLFKAMEVVVGTNKEKLDPVFRPANFLENVQSGNLIWRFADPPRRYPDLDPSHSFEFLACHTGSRVKIQHPKLAGTQFIGIEFGYGPDCGRVGVRDCEGRLVATQDLFLPQRASVPQWTWITLPYVNRDGWIYLESLGEAPCSLGQKIALQKVMVVGNIEDGF